MNRNLDDSLVDRVEGNEIKGEKLPQAFAERSEICESRQDNREGDPPRGIAWTNREETCQIQKDDDTIRNEIPQENKTVEQAAINEQTTVVVDSHSRARRLSSDPNERQTRHGYRKTLQDLETKDKTVFEFSGTPGSQRVGASSSRREALSNSNERWAGSSSRKTVQDLETKRESDVKCSGSSGRQGAVSSSRCDALSNPNGRWVNRSSSRKTLRDLEEAKQKSGVQTSGISQRWISSSRREALSNPNEQSAGRSSRNSVQELEINDDPGSVRVIEADEEEGSEEDGRTIFHRMGSEPAITTRGYGQRMLYRTRSESAVSPEGSGRMTLFRVIEVDEEEGSEEDGQSILYTMGSQSAISTEEDGQTILYRMGSESPFSDERTILYRMGSVSAVSTVSSRVITAGEVENNEGISPALQNDRPKISNIPRRMILVGAILLSVLIAVVGAAFAFFSGEEGGGNGANPCDFTDIGQRMQCECDQNITKWSRDVFLRYQDLLSTMIPKVDSNFSEPSTSCTRSNLALLWLAADDFSSGTTDMVTLTNRYVLALLYLTWTGANWTTNEGWLSSESECTWHGITCNGTAITGIELGGNSLRSRAKDGLPTELFTLTSLKTFNASDAYLSGSIPSEIGSLVNLETLDLQSFNSYLGQYPSELFTLPKLRVLDLSYPTNGGSIPTVIGLATQLESLVAAAANLVGTIPSELGLATSLATLSLDTNGLSGTIPMEIGRLENLETLILSANKIDNTIPTELGALSSLVSLDLGYNALRGSIPVSVASLPNLGVFRLLENRLTGTVPEEVLASGNLECLDASSNLMDKILPQGTCPSSAGTLWIVCGEIHDSIEAAEACSCCNCAPVEEDYCSNFLPLTTRI